jgi:hypothetical protein
MSIHRVDIPKLQKAIDKLANAKSPVNNLFAADFGISSSPI